MHKIIVLCAWLCKQESNILKGKKQLQIFVLLRLCLANMAAMYAVFHGAEGLKNIAKRVAVLTQIVAESIEARGFELVSQNYFDTIDFKVDDDKTHSKKKQKDKKLICDILMIIISAFLSMKQS